MPLAVFLVEDNPRIRESLIPALAELGSASVMATAESEAEAFAWLARHKGRWDLAVVEFVLKQGTGLGVVKWCYGRESQQRVVVLSNCPTPPIRSACLAAGANAVFDKSTELDAFFDYCLQGRHRA